MTISGRVTYSYDPAVGISLNLRFYDGSTWSTISSTKTDANGKFVFSAPNVLGPNQEIYVRWDNETGNPDYLSIWQCNSITSTTVYSTNDYCVFDLLGFIPDQPGSGSIVSLPTTFTWVVRPFPGESYEFNLYGATGDPWWYTWPTLGWVGSYTLNSLPTGFVPNVEYRWIIGVYSPFGYGMSQWYETVTFSNSGQSEPGFSLMTQDMARMIEVPALPLLQERK